MGIYQDSLRHRHYYQLICGTPESEIDEIGFPPKCELDESDSSKVRDDMKWDIFKIQTDTGTTIRSHSGMQESEIGEFRFLPKTDERGIMFFLELETFDSGNVTKF